MFLKIQPPLWERCITSHSMGSIILKNVTYPFEAGKTHSRFIIFVSLKFAKACEKVLSLLWLWLKSPAVLENVFQFSYQSFYKCRCQFFFREQRPHLERTPSDVDSCDNEDCRVWCLNENVHLFWCCSSPAQGHAEVRTSRATCEMHFFFYVILCCVMGGVRAQQLASQSSCGLELTAQPQTSGFTG